MQQHLRGHMLYFLDISPKHMIAITDATRSAAGQHGNSVLLTSSNNQRNDVAWSHECHF